MRSCVEPNGLQRMLSAALWATCTHCDLSGLKPRSRATSATVPGVANPTAHCPQSVQLSALEPTPSSNLPQASPPRLSSMAAAMARARSSPSSPGRNEPSRASPASDNTAEAWIALAWYRSPASSVASMGPPLSMTEFIAATTVSPLAS